MDINHRKENGYRGQGRCRDSHANLFRASDSCLDKLFTEAHVSENALRHNDRIIHEHSHAQCQSSQRHDVQRDVSEVHQIKCGYDGNGNHNSDDHGGFDILEEDKEDKKCQDSTQDDRIQDRGYGILDVFGLLRYD